MGKVVYLTGAPASGKTTICRLLKEAEPSLMVWEYGARLAQHVQARFEQSFPQEDLRRRSAAVVTPKDIEEVDQALVDFIAEKRADSDIIIDSHPVTKEVFGFRITPFSLPILGALSPDEIWQVYVSPSVTIERIGADPAGRPMITEEEARFHTNLQASVAATYGIALGRAVYLFDNSRDGPELLERLRRRLK